MIKVTFYDPTKVADDQLKFAVIAARYQDKWVFSRHKARSTWDMPGGHIETGETALVAMERELWEETGSLKADITPVFAYSVTKNGATTYGMLYFAEIRYMGKLPEEYEMGEVCFADNLPKDLTYPDIQPVLFNWIQGWLNMQSNWEELWDLYDENRNATGKLHKRGTLIPSGYYHLVVHIWIINQDGKFLITKRSANKGFPNMWECTSGSALAGDNSLTAAMREVREETGLELDQHKGALVLTARKSDYFRDVWVFRQSFDLSDVKLQPMETVDKRFAGKEEILKYCEKGAFVPYDYLQELFSRI